MNERMLRIRRELGISDGIEAKDIDNLIRLCIEENIENPVDYIRVILDLE